MPLLLWVFHGHVCVFWPGSVLVIQGWSLDPSWTNQHLSLELFFSTRMKGSMLVLLSSKRSKLYSFWLVTELLSAMRNIPICSEKEWSSKKKRKTDGGIWKPGSWCFTFKKSVIDFKWPNWHQEEGPRERRKGNQLRGYINSSPEKWL